jgi:hypothetical protein
LGSNGSLAAADRLEGLDRAEVVAPVRGQLFDVRSGTHAPHISVNATKRVAFTEKCLDRT